MKLEIDVLKDRRVMVLLGMAIVLLAAVVVSQTSKHPKLQPRVSTNSIRVSSTSGNKGAANFTRQVYNAALVEWDSEEYTFITNHKAWFSKKFLDSIKSDSASQTYLFCDKPTHKPEDFTAITAWLSANKKSAVVYINSLAKSKQLKEVSNLSVRVVSENSLWVIDSLDCELF